VLPNKPLALLADGKTRLAALGEIDAPLSRANFAVCLCALVVKNLQADCFGETNFFFLDSGTATNYNRSNKNSQQAPHPTNQSNPHTPGLPPEQHPINLIASA
jgi:hypothetical protein